MLSEYTQRTVVELLKIRSTGGAVHASYIFKCGLHYLAMFKLFQRIIFACLLKEFLHVLAISYIVLVKIFFGFPI